MATMTTTHMLSCNNMTCRTRLSSGRVWVTYCSHIFCDPCGTSLTSTMACTSCRTDLSGKYKLTKKFLQPGIEWKRMALAGLSPEMIMDISSSAIQFYEHQTSLEVAYLEKRIERLRGRVESVKNYYEGVIKQFKRQIRALEMKLENTSNNFSMFDNNVGDENKKKGGSLTDLGFPSSSLGGIGSGVSLGVNNWEMNNSFEVDAAGLNFPSESSLNGSRPYKLTRTEINEQNKVEVNGQTMMFRERTNEMDHMNSTRTTSRSAQSSNSQLSLLLGRTRSATRSAQSSYSHLSSLLDKTGSATRLDLGGKGNSTKQLLPYFNRRF